MTGRKVSATINGTRYYAQPNNADGGQTVIVWTAAQTIGGYRIERFAGQTLTAATLRAVLTGGAS